MAKGAAEDVGAQPQATPASPGLARSMPPDPLRGAPVSDTLYERLRPEDVAAVEQAVAGSPTHLAEGAERRRLVVNLGVHHGVTGVLERTGLTQAMPPGDVHSMARGPRAAGGSLYYADLVVDGLAEAGFEISRGMRALDFGCSSGRVVRVLAAAYPDVEWHGCDPIADAIDWADANLPGASFVRSPQRPPLPYDEGSFDFVYAISVWSHFDAPAALAWLAEMRRIIRPGGALLISTHGHQTITHDLRTGRRPATQLEQVRSGLYDAGFWYWAEFGPHGDHGVVDAEWGTAFLTPEWLLSRTTRRVEARHIRSRASGGQPGPVRARAALAECVRSRS